MAKRIHYVLSPLFYLVVLAAGRLFTLEGLDSWYPTLMKPTYTPPGELIAVVWTTIYALSAASLVLFVNRGRGSGKFWFVIGLYAVNGMINALWSYIFFVRHALGLAVIDAAAITLTVAAIMVDVWPHRRLSSLLLLPYLFWGVFAVSLTYSVYVMN